LNIHIKRNRQERTIHISQPIKISNVLNDSQLCLKDKEYISRPNSVPALPNLTLSKEMEPKNQEKKERMKLKPYRSILGQVLYISITARPDLATAVSNCGKYAANPGVKHWEALLMILRYLQGTQNLALKLGGIHNKFILSGYCDADWGGDNDTKKSRSGVVIFLNNSPIYWSSKLQKCVSLSSTEAEYICLTTGATSILWNRSLLQEIGFTRNDNYKPRQSLNHKDCRIEESPARSKAHRHTIPLYS
jgi:hypothetical protein